MVRSKSEQTAYVIKICLSGSKPQIWRRFCVPGELTLDRLHDIVQIVMGWQDYHLYCFEIAGQRYTESPEDAEDEGHEAGQFRLSDLVSFAETRLVYEYDFGDGWKHELFVEIIDRVPKGHHACIGCMDGKRRCPPEDVGGVDGYAEFLTALGDPKRLERDSHKEWCDGSFDPEMFSPDAVNLELAKFARWSRPRILSQSLVVREFSDA